MYEKQDFINEGIEIGKEIAKKEFINEGIEIGKEIAKEEGQLLAAETLLSKQLAKGKKFTEEQAIRFLSDNLDLPVELSRKAYQSIMKC